MLPRAVSPIYIAIHPGGAGLMRRGPAQLAAMLIVLGTMLFCGDLAIRALAQVSLIPMAAPTGGVMLMLGWLGLAVAALLPERTQA